MRSHAWFALVLVAELLSTVTGQIPNCTLDIPRTLDTEHDPTSDPGLIKDPKHVLSVVPGHGPTEDSNHYSSLGPSVVSIDCLITENKIWNFSYVKEWMSNNSFGPVHVSITCQSGGCVHLRRPIKANNLETLHIKSCHITGTDDTDFSVQTSRENYTIRHLTIEDSNVVILLSELRAFYMDNYKQNQDVYPCGYPPSLERLTYRNTSQTTLPDIDIPDSELLELEKTIERYNMDKQQCINPNLKYLEFTQNYIISDHKLYEQFLHKYIYPRLKVMNISHLLLSRAPDQLSKFRWDIDFPELELIDLSHNRITTIDFTYPPPKRKHLTVDLSYNQISVLRQPSIQNLRNFYPGVVNLRGNQWVCNCSQQDFVQFLQEEEGPIIDEYAYLGEARCSRPLSRLGQYIKNVEDLCGPRSDTQLSNLVLYVCLPPLILCFFVIIVLVRFRREIRVLVFTRFTSVSTCLFVPVPTSSKSVEKDFDAFVSYSSLDETWVYDLCRRLEESVHKFRLCLHHKHFIPGACISDNIIDSVERSRHTIMVLSPNFLKSEWCILEFRKAFHQSLVENERHLVVVMLEGFDESCVHADLKHFLKTYTYLKTSDFFFWDKLVYALSKNWIDHRKKNPSGSGGDKNASEALLSVAKSE
ncbi:toll-like receptor 4 [Ylistrum balloti]|uniref:toll-like receptor 4 n=1 Tax=Ylistrum balloti TaxID=509963 RepID=UPI002905C07E|nr:toll-like receptor 4 [Ylistrum balloti]